METRVLGPTLFVAFGLALTACSAESDSPEPSEPISSISNESVGGCACPTSGTCSALTFTDIPADGKYYITTFGGGADTQGMACGGTADGTWAYIADSSRFGCGAKVQVAANGKSCVTQVADCGPNRCVEQAACYCSCSGHHPIIDASPFITKYLLGLSGVGWSDKITVTATLVDDASKVGCPGTVAGAGGTGGTSGTGGASTGGTSGAGGTAGSAQGGSTSGGTGGTVASGGSGGVSTTGGSGGSATGGKDGGSSGGTKQDGGSNVTRVEKDDDSGCGCRLGAREAKTPLAALVASALGLMLLRRRRSSG